MAIEQLDYAAILADLEAKRNALDQAITSFRNALASGALGLTGEFAPSVNGTGGEVPAGAFFGKSIPEAAKLYLEIVKKKQTSKEIADAFQKGGMETNSRNFPQMVHSVLDRARKANSGIVKLDRSHWGLAGWYPAGLIRTGAPSPEKRSGRKKARKGKPSAKPTETATAKGPAIVVSAQPQGPTARQRTMHLLQHNPSVQYSGEAVSKELGITRQVSGMMLSQLFSGGLIQKTSDGKYFFPQNNAAVS